MKTCCIIVTLILFCCLIVFPALSQEAAETDAAADTSVAKADTTKTDKKKKKDDEKDFADVIEDYTVIEGLFTLYRNEKDGKVFIEIGPDQMDKIFMCTVTREAGDGYYYDSGALLDAFPFVLTRVGKKIQFIHKNVYYRADADNPIADAVSRGVSSSIIGSSKIESKPHPDRNSLLVSLDGFFLQDYTGVEYSLNEFAKVGFKFDKDESYFGMLKSFPMNTEIETVLHFKNSKPKPSLARIPDGRSMQHHYRFSLSTLPENDYRPRLADDRVGHFLTMYQDYSDQTLETPYVRYVNRWHLQKSNTRSKISKPKQPIVFWLENTIPKEHRQAVKEGALMWNDAFEIAGFKEAIVVKQQPDDAEWDPADVRYNTIRWIVRPGAGYAVGPSRTNPFTGEILSADIRVSADYVRSMVRRLGQYVDPLSMISQMLDPTALSTGLFGDPPLGANPLTNTCNYGQGKALQAGFGWSVLTARGSMDPNSREAKNYVRDAIKDLIAHEVGHTIGLRHNFRASTIRTDAERHDKGITHGRGVTGSVMDYNPVNLAPKGKPQGEYWSTAVGEYDRWAIEYAYKPIDARSPEKELKELKKIASRVAEPKLAYATDEDAYFSAQGIDPTASRWDLGADPVGYYKERLDLADELLRSIETKFDQKGERYQTMRSVFRYAWVDHIYAALTVSKYIGGIYHRRDHIGDAGARTPFEPVSADKQREAMAFLTQNIFGQDALTPPPSLMKKLSPERYYDFDFSLWYVPRLDYPMHTAVLSFQAVALNRLYHPIAMSRMVDLELYYEDASAGYSLAEMFGEVRAAVWTEVETGENINSFRRNLQRAHLGKLVSLVAQPSGAPFFSPSSGQKPAGTIMPPADAITLARADLKALEAGIESALDGSELDATSRAHLEESLARIEATLSAQVQRRM